MIRHIVMWKFRPGTEAEQAQFLEGLKNLQGVIPQLLKSEVAVNVGADNYDAVLVSEFESLEALELYKNDPRHKAVSALCKSIREDRVAVDYEFSQKIPLPFWQRDFLLFQGNSPAIQFSVFQRNNAIERMVIVTNTAGIQEQGFSPHIHKGTMRVAEQEQIQILFLSGVSGVHHRLLDAVGVAMAD